MKFYVAGKKVRDIDDMKAGEMYSVCGIVGKLELVPTPTTFCSYKFESEEGVMLLMHRNALTDRIYCGFVREVKKEFKPREKTIRKIISGIKI